MSRTLRRLRSGILALGTAGALGFGAVHAFATPAAAAAPVCNEQACNNLCELVGGPFASGTCVDGECKCAL
jgi:type IV secretory pathway VirB2 component (pilin)